MRKTFSGLRSSCLGEHGCERLAGADAGAGTGPIDDPFGPVESWRDEFAKICIENRGRPRRGRTPEGREPAGAIATEAAFDMSAKKRSGRVVEDVERRAWPRVDLEQLGVSLRDQEIEKDEPNKAKVLRERDAGRNETRLEVGLEADTANRSAVAVWSFREGRDPLPARGESMLPCTY